MEIYEFMILHSAFAGSRGTFLVKRCLRQAGYVFHYKFFEYGTNAAFFRIERVTITVKTSWLRKQRTASLETLFTAFLHGIRIDIFRKIIVTIVRFGHGGILIPSLRIVFRFVAAQRRFGTILVFGAKERIPNLRLSTSFSCTGVRALAERYRFFHLHGIFRRSTLQFTFS
jgi:hypothetical protein